MPEVSQPVTFTLQLVLDQGAWEEVLTVDADDADVLQDLLSNTSVVHYDIQRRTLMFGAPKSAAEISAARCIALSGRYVLAPGADGREHGPQRGGSARR